MRIMRIISIVFVSLFVFLGCDMIQQEIERAQSLRLEDFSVDIPNQSISLLITSDADEPVITAVVVNDVRYDLISGGENWYVLSEVPVATRYIITDVYYRTSVGVVLSYNVNFDISLDDAIDALPVDQVSTIEETLIIGAYTFTRDEEALVIIESEHDYTVQVLEDWAWLILEHDKPVFAVFEYKGELYVVEAQEFLDAHIE